MDPFSAAAAFEPVFVPGPVDQDAAHGLGRGGEEVSPSVPIPRLTLPDQTEVSLVDQSRGLEGLAGLLVGEASGRQCAQLVVDDRE